MGETAVDLLDEAHRQDLPVRPPRELVGAVARTDRDGERVDAGALDEVDGLVGVGEVDLARADAVLDPSERAELALHGDPARVRILDDLARDGDVVVVVRDGRAVLLQGAVHHHAREPELDRADARRR
jgi:hypothetical protein